MLVFCIHVSQNMHLWMTPTFHQQGPIGKRGIRGDPGKPVSIGTVCLVVSQPASYCIQCRQAVCCTASSYAVYRQAVCSSVLYSVNICCVSSGRVFLCVVQCRHMLCVVRPCVPLCCTVSSYAVCSYAHTYTHRGK